MRHSTLLTILVILSACSADAQKTFKDYLIGVWKCTDSSTGIKQTIHFEKNETVIFDGKDATKWKYSTQIKDSIIYLTYNIKSKNASLYNEGILVLQNDTCFWWFNPSIYEKYISAKDKGYHITHKNEFDAWLQRNRDVCYRLATKQ